MLGRVAPGQRSPGVGAAHARPAVADGLGLQRRASERPVLRRLQYRASVRPAPRRNGCPERDCLRHGCRDSDSAVRLHRPADAERAGRHLHRPGVPGHDCVSRGCARGGDDCTADGQGHRELSAAGHPVLRAGRRVDGGRRHGPTADGSGRGAGRAPARRAGLREHAHVHAVRIGVRLGRGGRVLGRWLHDPADASQGLQPRVRGRAHGHIGDHGPADPPEQHHDRLRGGGRECLDRRAVHGGRDSRRARRGVDHDRVAADQSPGHAHRRRSTRPPWGRRSCGRCPACC